MRLCVLDASTSSIHTGLGQTNLIAVVANNDVLNLYVNHQLINTQQDNTFISGQIAVVAENVNSPTEVVFRNAKVWQPAGRPQGSSLLYSASLLLLSLVVLVIAGFVFHIL